MSFNVFDYIKGSRPVMSVAPFVSGGSGGSPVFSDVGTISAPELDPTKSIKDITADSAFYVLDKFYTGQKLTGKVTIHEADLAKLALFMGDPSTAITTVARSAGVTDGTQTYKLDEQTAIQYYQLKLEVANQSLNLGSTDTYTSFAAILWRVVFDPKSIKLVFKRDDHYHYDVAFEALYDSSVAGTDGHIGYFELRQPA